MAKLRSLLPLVALLAASMLLSSDTVRTQGDQPPLEQYNGRDVAQGEVLVRLRDTVRLAEVYRAGDVNLDRRVGSQGWRRLRSSSRSVQALITLLKARQDVLSVEPNYVLQAAEVPNDPLFPSLWGMQAGAGTRAVDAWNITTGSTGTVVAVVDSGVDYNHPDLAPNMWSAPTPFSVTVGGETVNCPAGSHGFNALTFSCDPMDDQGHGTHVAGTIGATGNNALGVAGMNWTTRIMALKFLNSQGNGFTSDAVNAIDFAIQTKAAFAATSGANVRVLSNSYGGYSSDNVLPDAINRAAQANMLFVAAAGNNDNNNDANPYYPASYPQQNVISVGSIDQAANRAGTSNYGATTVDLAAPGENIQSTMRNGEYGGSSGTSMATPHVSGAAALLLGACSLSTQELKAAILGAVAPTASFAGISVTGGRLDVAQALATCAVPPTVTLNSPADGATYAAPASISLAATANDADGISKVEFYNGTTLIATSTTAPFGGDWSGVTPGTYAIHAKAYDGKGLFAKSAVATVTVTGAPPVASASFVGGDASTKGNWKGVYGAQGHVMANATTSMPSYAQFGVSGASTHTWDAAPTDMRALQRAATGRIAAAWYATNSFTLDINVIDGGAHRVSVYAVDWETNARTERIDVLDASNLAVLDTRTLSGFNGGQFLSWQVTGHVLIRTTYTGSGNSGVLSGLFFDAPSANTTVQLTSPAPAASFVAPATIQLSASVLPAPGRTIDHVDFLNGTTIIAADNTSPFSATWEQVPVGNHSLTARAVDDLGTPTSSSPVSISVTASSGTATFVGADATTAGNWQGIYGAQGVMQANATTSLPAYAQVSMSGASTHTWDAAPSATRALQRVGGGRIAACWYSTSSFTFDVNLTDGQPHRVSIYALDWETNARTERIEVLDLNGTVIDTRTIGSFNGGQYMSWQLTGHVLLRVTYTGAGNSGVASGLFFDAPSTTTTVQLTSPAGGSAYTAPAAIPLGATVTAAAGRTIDHVDFLDGTTVVATDTSAPYSQTWSNVGIGAYSLTARATDDLGQTTTSAAAVVTVSAPSVASATFVRKDTTTQGTWHDVYGRQGYALVNDTTSLPSYAQLAVSGAATYTWASSTSDLRALERGGTGRIAACWYSTSNFTLDVNLTDGGLHQVALYALDWETTARAEWVDVIDVSNGSVLDSQTISGFNGGQYLVWTLGGHVQLRVTYTGSGNSGVLSGVFFDSASADPSVTMSSPAAGASFTAPATVSFAASAIASPGRSIDHVDFLEGTTVVATSFTSPYTGTWPNVGVGAYSVTARATDNMGGIAQTSPRTIVVSPPSTNGASFVGSDVTTQGSWKGVYGAQGYALANDATSLPAFAQLSLGGVSNHTWQSPSSDLRALQRGVVAGRIAACWYSTSNFTIDLNLTDGGTHQVTVYALDWETNARTERIDVLDATTGAVLDTRNLSGFNGGQYLTWSLSGHVILRVTYTGVGNAGVISGVFF